MMDILAGSAVCFSGGLLIFLQSKRSRKEEHPQEWLFTALACGRRDLVVKGDPDIYWNEPHPHFGTPLHAIGGMGIQLQVDGWPYYDFNEESNACIKDLLALFEFAIKRGADPAVICPCSCSGCIRFTVRGGGKILYDLKEPVGGRSVISVWLALSQRAKDLDNHHPDQLPLASSFFDGILSLLLHIIPKHEGCVPKCQGSLGHPAMAEVPEATAGMWQKMMQNEEACDVVLRCPDGEVRVHSAVVSSASKVLSAMLCWPREVVVEAEGHAWEPRHVQLEDRREVVVAWRELVYTGLPPAEGLTTALLLDVLDLSHRWQDHLLECGLLTSALAKRIVDGESCGLVLQAALAKDLPDLRSECLTFARRSREVRRDWERGLFSSEVSKQLGSVLGVARRGGSVRAASTRRWDL